MLRPTQLDGSADVFIPTWSERVKKKDPPRQGWNVYRSGRQGSRTPSGVQCVIAREARSVKKLRDLESGHSTPDGVRFPLRPLL
jgi:hypothetical protein